MIKIESDCPLMNSYDSKNNLLWDPPEKQKEKSKLVNRFKFTMEVLTLENLYICFQAYQFIRIKNTGVHLKNPYPTNNSFFRLL